jgi:hypothetical protein
MEGPDERARTGRPEQVPRRCRHPCQRDELLQTAAAQGAGDGVLGQIGKLPEQDYADIGGVTRALYGEP